MTRDGDDVRTWGAEAGLEIGNVTAMHHGERRSWVAGQFGVALFDGARFRSLPLVDGDLLHGVSAIIETPRRDDDGGSSSGSRDDSFGDLWIHADAGIFYVPAVELRHAIANPERRVAYRSFDFVAGLPDDPIQIRPLPTAIEDRDGRLWFATGNGVVWIDPEQLAENTVPPPVLIETVRVADVSIPASADMTLPKRTSRVEIGYTALSLAVPEGVRFRYRLDGYDTRWHDAGAAREAVYTGLGPGSFRFHVQAANSDGVWNEQGATLRFEIPPMFYETRTFPAFCTALALASLWWLYRSRMQRAAGRLRLRLEERHAERERIARELHDTLLQGFQGLVLRFQGAAERLPTHEPVRRVMEQTLDRADEVLAEGRDRVKDLRAAMPAPELAQALSAVAREMAYGDAAVRVLSVAAPRPLDAAARDEVYWIGREALANSLRHARAWRVDVHVVYGSRALRLDVRDDGGHRRSKST